MAGIHHCSACVAGLARARPVATGAAGGWLRVVLAGAAYGLMAVLLYAGAAAFAP
jgi:hypothetical protein